MIIVRLEGGLGNQMFQYALGRHLSLINKTELKFDLSGLDKKNYAPGMVQRELRLTVFDTLINIASEQEIRDVVTSGISKVENLIYKIQRRSTIPYFRKNELFENTWFKFDKNMLRAGKNVHLTGYWQSFHYFKAIREVLLNEFTFKEYPNQHHYPFSKSIHEQNSVSLHIRRGDYINNSDTLKLHGICSTDYYQAAVKEISRRIKKPVFYIFSDDINWVKENFSIDYPCIYVSETEQQKDYFDMHLMSTCKHNIIANSSFSWWGAWLNRNPYKIVLAPKKWMADHGINTNDLVPENWIRL